jgi:hypothetical protein
VIDSFTIEGGENKETMSALKQEFDALIKSLKNYSYDDNKAFALYNLINSYIKEFSTENLNVLSTQADMLRRTLVSELLDINRILNTVESGE